MKVNFRTKILGVLEKYPEVAKRRAQLKAIGYLWKRHNHITVRWQYDYKGDLVAITNLNTVLCLNPLTEYKYDSRT